MTFKGLFIGIDRYKSPHIKWLSYAKRDAVALHALFSDTLGEGAKLFTDEQATRPAIEKCFKELVNAHKDDVVVIAYSGHGTPTHELVTYDTDRHNLSDSSISLDTLNGWFSKIPARRLICFLDCCFSGGMGAKVLDIDTVARALRSTDEVLDQISGTGRLIFTASSPTEPAYENMRLRHGFLTYYLLEALQGAKEVQKSGKLAVYRLLEYVTKRVIDTADQLGKPQHPCLRGKLEGELTWPIFRPGPLFQAAFPEYVHPKVSSDLQSLEGYGFPPSLIQSWAGAIPSLNQLQVDAINEFGLLEGNHLVVSAPTSSGKTMIGELATLKGALDRKRALFLLPLKALVNDKQRYFTEIYGSFGIRTIEATGDSDDITPLLMGHYDICLLTYEKFAAVILTNPHILEQVGTIVIDEVQMIADESRGANLEFILTLLRMRQRQGIEPQLIALSAVIGDTNGLERWLGARLLRRDERPVPLDEGLLLGDGRFRHIDALSNEEKITEPVIMRIYRKGTSQDLIIPLVQKLVQEGERVIVFRETKPEARACARYLARELRLPCAQPALDALPTGDPTKASQDLRETLNSGIAFHMADLDREERRVIEEQFRAPDTNLRVIAATTTLAMGVNTPAEAVIIAGLEHPGPNRTKIPYSVAEYKNLVGRAGRLGYSKRGTSYLIALNPREEHYTWDRYITGRPEDLQSRFLHEGTDPRTLIVRVLAATQRTARQGINTEDIVQFLEFSFGAFQEAKKSDHWKWDRSQLLQALQDLQNHNLIELDEKRRYRLSELGRLAGEAGIEVVSIIRLVDCLRPLDPATIHDPTLITAAQLTAELDQIHFPLNRRSTEKEPRAWVSELRNQGVPGTVLNYLTRWAADKHQKTLRAKKAVACLLHITPRKMAEIETVLTRFGGALGGAAGPLWNVTSRTCDVLTAVFTVAEILHPNLDLTERLKRLLPRLDIGLPSPAVDLALQVGSRFTRADYLRLFEANLCNMENIEASSDEALLNCLQNDKKKLGIVRSAVKRHREQESEDAVQPPILEPYEG